MDCSVHNILSFCWLVCLFISPSFHCALWSAFGLLRKKIDSFSHSVSLSLLHLYLTLSKIQHQKTFTLYAGATKEVNSPATHKGIKHSAGATTSCSSVVLLFCSWWISLCMLSNDDSGGRGNRVINFSLLVVCPLSITRIRQQIINLVIRSYYFWHPLKTGSRSGTNLLFSFYQSVCILLQSRVYRILTHYWYPKRSLLREDLRSFSLTLENIWNRRRWLLQASISLSKMTQSWYSGSNWIYYSLPSLVSDTAGCDFGYSFISDPVFDCHLPAFLLPSRYTISVALRSFLIRAKDFLRVAKCYQDFVAPAPCHIPLWVAGLFTSFVAPALRENAFWCCLLDCSRERYSRYSEAEWENEWIRGRPKADKRA